MLSGQVDQLPDTKFYERERKIKFKDGYLPSWTNRHLKMNNTSSSGKKRLRIITSWNLCSCKQPSENKFQFAQYFYSEKGFENLTWCTPYKRKTYSVTLFGGMHVLSRNSMMEYMPIQVWFWIKNFPSPKVVAISRLKCSVSPTNYP